MNNRRQGKVGNNTINVSGAKRNRGAKVESQEVQRVTDHTHTHTNMLTYLPEESD